MMTCDWLVDTIGLGVKAKDGGQFVFAATVVVADPVVIVGPGLERGAAAAAAALPPPTAVV